MKEAIQEYIEDNSTTAIIQQPKYLYYARFVYDFQLDAEKLSCSAKVKDSRLYDVQIQLSKNPKDIVATCTCPHDRGGLCQHIVAVLLVCQDNLPFKKEVPLLPSQNHLIDEFVDKMLNGEYDEAFLDGDPTLVIENYRDKITDIIEKYAHPDVIEQAANERLEVAFSEFDPENEIVFRVESHRYYDHSNEVIFTKTDNGIEVYYDCDEFFDSLCIHAVAAFDLMSVIDGQSSKKSSEQRVGRFQNEEDCGVFLISLKAGGTGLSLTAADYVFLADPMWNPAVESQAIDRCYRIGQNKNVFAYIMICKNTVEEKIINYQLRKKVVARDIIQAEENFIKQLTADNIKGLYE